MENIAFVSWMLLYPIVCSLTSYLGTKEREIQGKDYHSETTTVISAWVHIFIWVYTGNILLNSN